MKHCNLGSQEENAQKPLQSANTTELGLIIIGSMKTKASFRFSSDRNDNGFCLAQSKLCAPLCALRATLCN
jgi:hypothetical protein